MTALEVIQDIVQRLGLAKAEISFVEHQVGLNWRELYSNSQQRLEHLTSSLVQPAPLREWKIPGHQILEKSFDPLECARPDTVVSICSKLRERGVTRHLALMNLHPDGISEQELTAIIAEVTHGMQGYLLRSGRFWHFYGLALLGAGGWHRFLAQFLMPTILVSPRYIGHALYKGYATLRLTPEPHYKPMTPEVVARCHSQGENSHVSAVGVGAREKTNSPS